MPDTSTERLPRLGRYQVLSKIAEGGMAEIFLAKSLGAMGFERLVAIKLIRTHLTEDSDFVKMFLDEARIAMHLHHRNIVQTSDLEKANETYFIAMEFVHGVNGYDLYERVAERGEWIDLPLALYIISEACKGLHFAHTRCSANGTPLGIVHRDVSPQNILLSFEGEVKIMDFGIAKATERLHQTMPGIVKGKYAYMAPEILHDQEADGRVDVFAAGVVLYELLTRENPFAGGNAVETIEAVLGKKVMPPTEKSGAGSRALDKIVLKALAKNPDHRFQTARELSDALTDHGLGLTGARWDIATGDSSVANLLREIFPTKAAQTFTLSSAEEVNLPRARGGHDADPPENEASAQERQITSPQNYAAQKTLLRVSVEDLENDAEEYDEEAQTAVALDPDPVTREQKEPTTANTLPPEPETDLSLAAVREEDDDDEEVQTQLQSSFLDDQIAMDSSGSATPLELQDRGPTRAPLKEQKRPSGFVDPSSEEFVGLKFHEPTPKAVEIFDTARHRVGDNAHDTEANDTRPPFQNNSPYLRTASFPEADIIIPEPKLSELVSPSTINEQHKKNRVLTVGAYVSVAIMVVVIVFTIVLMRSGAVPMVNVPVTSQPSGATVIINGKIQSNKTPLSAIVPSGRRHRIEISVPGYKTFSKDIEPQVGAKIQINAILSSQ